MSKLFLSIITLIVSISLIYSTFLNYKNKNINKIEFSFWTCGWIFLIFLSIRSKSFDNFIEKNLSLNLFYLLNILSFLFIFFLVFRYYLKIKILEKKIDTLIRSEALSKIYKEINRK
jgi:hypothetical protein